MTDYDERAINALFARPPEELGMPVDKVEDFLNKAQMRPPGDPGRGRA
jgi:hypothetical protein